MNEAAEHKTDFGPSTRTAKSPAGPWSRLVDLFFQSLPSVLALGCVAGLVALGLATGWSLPRPSSLTGPASEESEWCEEHSVPESICVECKPSLLPRGNDYGWCREHGVHQCPLEHPDVAQLPTPPIISQADRDRAARALQFAPRVENNSACKLHERRIQFVSEAVIDRLGIGVTAAAHGKITESVSAPGEFVYDPTTVARLAPRTPGTVWRIEKQVGATVAAGEVLALVDSSAVGKAKADFQQALVERDLRRQVLDSMRGATGAVSGRTMLDAEAAIEEAEVRVLTAEQSLLNLGMPIQSSDFAQMTTAEVGRRLRFLGLPVSLARELENVTASNNLIPIRSPHDGVVVTRNARPGDAADPTKPLFVVADTRRMWLMLKVRAEDVGKVKPGQSVRFTHDAHAEGDAGAVAWVSPAAEEQSRAVLVRVEVPNADHRHHANTFGTARIVLREEPSAVVIPSEAVHWEGDCHVVFVRDRRFTEEGGPKVFHVRSVRPGATDATAAGSVTEIIAGLLPGEWVATVNSGVLRSELLKNNLGAG